MGHKTGEFSVEQMLEGVAAVDDCVSPASFSFPHALTESAWHQHAPFAFWLMDALRPRTFVELGTHHGFSYLSFCQAAVQLRLDAKGYAIDTWRGDEHAGFYDDEVFKILAAYHDPRYGQFSRLVRSTFDDALAHFADGSIDLLHIDGRHFYDDIKHDFESWREKLSDSAVVLFHDTNVRERGFGVFRYWAELSQQYPAFEFLHGHGLGVLGVGDYLPERVNKLLTARAALTTQIRKSYSRLGVAIEDRHTNARHEARIADLERELTAARREAVDQLATARERFERLEARPAEDAERFAQVTEEFQRLQRAKDKVERQYEEQSERMEEVERGAEQGLTRIVELETQLRRERAARESAESQHVETYFRLGDLKKKSTSSRWLLAAVGGKIIHAPRDISRRVRRSWRKRHAILDRNTADRSTLTIADEGHQRPHLNYLREKLAEGYRPKVSAIIPNFNHAKYLDQRLRSITSQTLPPSEIIFLDDASTDNSRDVLEAIAKDSKFPITSIYNDVNSGNVFKQWQKGVSSASGDLIWICESDDYCDPDFLQKLTCYFADPSVMIAFGNIQFADAEGQPIAGLDDYRESAAPGHWRTPRLAGAYEWFRGPFAKRNVIANVGGCLIRSQSIEERVWKEAQSYKVCGDWYLYMHLSRGGQIAFDPEAISYFRQHKNNTSVSSFNDHGFYREHHRIGIELRRLYDTPHKVINENSAHVKNHFISHVATGERDQFDSIFDLEKINQINYSRKHIVIGILGFRVGGGELFPIHLANALLAKGYVVSVLVLDRRRDNSTIRTLLDNRIAIYEKLAVEEIGLSRFLETIGADLIHTHFVGIDLWMLHITQKPVNIPYVVTHHGSYEITNLDFYLKKTLLNRVNHWVYIADKNLAAFDGFLIDEKTWTKLPNGVPDKPRSFALDRAQLGIEDNAFIFGVASRALKDKGWSIAAEALKQLQQRTERPVYIVFCGEGEDFSELYGKYYNKHNALFLGYQEDIVGFYQFCDCCILPTRFQGESFPLTLIESLKAGTPCISTDIGEIGNIVNGDQISAGIVLPFVADEGDAIELLCTAMEHMLDPSALREFKRAAKLLGEKFSFAALVDRYEHVYKRVFETAPNRTSSHRVPSYHERPTTDELREATTPEQDIGSSHSPSLGFSKTTTVPAAANE